MFTDRPRNLRSGSVDNSALGYILIFYEKPSSFLFFTFNLYAFVGLYSTLGGKILLQVVLKVENLTKCFELLNKKMCGLLIKCWCW